VDKELARVVERPDDVQAVSDLLERNQMVVMEGMAGVGKTVLAGLVVDAMVRKGFFPDEVYVVHVHAHNIFDVVTAITKDHTERALEKEADPLMRAIFSAGKDRHLVPVIEGLSLRFDEVCTREFTSLDTTLRQPLLTPARDAINGAKVNIMKEIQGTLSKWITYIKAPSVENTRDQELAQRVRPYRSEKALIVLDDVQDPVVLDTLAQLCEGHSWKILATTRRRMASCTFRGVSYEIPLMDDAMARAVLDKWSTVRAFEGASDRDAAIAECLAHAHGLPAALYMFGKLPWTQYALVKSGRTPSSFQGESILDTLKQQITAVFQTNEHYAFGVQLPELLRSSWLPKTAEEDNMLDPIFNNHLVLKMNGKLSMHPIVADVVLRLARKKGLVPITQPDSSLDQSAAAVKRVHICDP